MTTEVFDHSNGWLLVVDGERYPHNPGRRAQDVGYSLRPDIAGMVLKVVRCTLCGRCWMRNVDHRLMPGQLGAWFCPRGWGNGNGCGGAYFVTVERPEVEAVWRLTGRYGFGDTEGHP